MVLLSQARDVVDMPALGGWPRFRHLQTVFGLFQLHEFRGAALAACERGSQWHIAAALLEDDIEG